MLILWIMCTVLGVMAVFRAADLVCLWRKRSVRENCWGVVCAAGWGLSAVGAALSSFLVLAVGVVAGEVGDFAAQQARGERVARQAAAAMQDRCGSDTQSGV